METHFATIWESIADAVPDHDAVVHGDRHVSWRDYEDRSSRLAQAFLDAGLGPDSKVGMFMYNCPEYAETQFAALKIRAVPVNVNYRYLDDELLYLLDNADAEAGMKHDRLG
ncbi:MAG: AMP-binding protein, partial [Actinomycetota bacterium]